MLDLRTVDLGRLNSLTKYPSIPTYHALDPSNGGLLEEPTRFPGEVLLTEKVDGTNARVVCMPDHSFVIGSRGEFLLARGDLIGNPAMGIADHLRQVAAEMADRYNGDAVRIYFGEVFGGRVTQASKQYTSGERLGFRLFDVVDVPDAEDRLAMDAAAISEWREGGGQRFLAESQLVDEANQLGLELTPRLATVETLPTTIEEALEFLDAHIPTSLSRLDHEAGGKPEGLVARSLDRAVIAKLRFEDYRRTLKRRNRK